MSQARPTDNSDHPDDDRLDRLDLFLASYHEALLQGKATDEAIGGSTDEDELSGPELRRAKRVIEGLARARVLTPALGDTIAPDLPALSWAEFSRVAVAGHEGPVLQRLGRFEIERELGRGGLGVVFLAHDPVLGRRIALKVPRPEALLTEEARLRFTREAKAAARLTHPNLVAVHEVGQAGPVTYIVSALCEGPNLATWLAGAPLPGARLAARIIKSLAEGVHHAHTLGILHRDIKPQNVLLEPVARRLNGTPDAEEPGFVAKLTDFGLARIVGLGEHPTVTGAILGTPAYMSPEQAEGHAAEVGPTTDVYGLGTVLYELLVGRGPFENNGGGNVLHRVIHEEPRRPRDLVPNTPPDLEAICLTCLEKRPLARYPSAAELADDLGRYLAGEPTRARPIGPLGKAARWIQRQPWIAGLGALVFSLLITIATVSTLAAFRIAHERDLAEQAEQVSENALAERQKALEAEALALKEAQSSAAEASRQAGVATREATRAKREADTANRLSDLLLGLFRGMDATGLGGLGIRGAGELGRELTSREMLERAVTLLRSPEFARDDPIVLARLSARLSKTCRLAGMSDEASHLSSQALQALELAGDRATAADRALVKQAAGFVLYDSQKLEAAAHLLREALAHGQAAVGEGQLAVLDLATIKFDLAWVLGQGIGTIADPTQRDFAEPERLLREVLATRRQALGDAHPDVFTATTALTITLLSRPDQGPVREFFLRELVPIFSRQPGGDRFSRAVRLFVGGMEARKRFDHDGAIDRYKTAIDLLTTPDVSESTASVISSDHPAMMVLWGEYAGACKQNGDYRAGEPAILKVIEISDRVLPNGHPLLIGPLLEYAQELADRQDFDRSDQIARRAFAIASRFRATSPSSLGGPISHLIRNAVAAGDPADLEPTLVDIEEQIRTVRGASRAIAGDLLVATLSGLSGLKPNDCYFEVIDRAEKMATELQVADFAIHRFAAQLFLGAGRPKDALRHVDHIIRLEIPRYDGELSPRPAWILSGVAKLEMQIGETGRGGEHARRVFSTRDHLGAIAGGAFDALVDGAVSKKDIAGAIKLCEETIQRLAPNEHAALCDAYVRLATCQLCAGESLRSLDTIAKTFDLPGPINGSIGEQVLAAQLHAMLRILTLRLTSDADRIVEAIRRVRERTDRVTQKDLPHEVVHILLDSSGRMEASLAGKKQGFDNSSEFTSFLNPDERAVWDQSITSSALGILENAYAISNARGKSFPTWRMRVELEQALGHWLATAGRWEEAEAKLLSVYERAGAQLASRHVIVLGIAADLVRLYTLQGRSADAAKFQKFIDDNTLAR